MNEALQNATEELKRIDHLIFVSLKYTRTCDVILSVLQRMTNAYDFMIQSLLDHAKDQKKLTEYPQSPALRCEVLLKTLNDETIKTNIEFYTLLRSLIRAPFDRRKEYRRHVTMIATLKSGIFEVNTDMLREYFDDTKSFFLYIKEYEQNE